MTGVLNKKEMKIVAACHMIFLYHGFGTINKISNRIAFCQVKPIVYVSVIFDLLKRINYLCSL